MFTLAWRHLMEHKVRSLLTMLGIVLSVALMLGVGILNDTMLKTFEYMILQSSGKSDITVIKRNGVSRLDMEWIENCEGIVYISEIFNTGRSIRKPDGEREYMSISGIDLQQDREMREYILKEGDFFTAEDAREFIMNSEGALKLGLSLNDYYSMETGSGIKKYQLVGILEEKGAGVDTNGITVYVPRTAIQKDMRAAGRINMLDIDAGDDEYLATDLGDKIKKKFGDLVTVNNLSSNIKMAKQSMSSMVFAFNIILIVVFFVSCFLIYNTFTVIILERIKLIGLLKTLGMDRKQTVKMVLIEGVAMGLSGTAIGLVLGLAAGKGLLAFMSVLDRSTDYNSFHIPLMSVVLATLTGLIMPIVSAYLPARKASKFMPLEALKIDDGLYSRSKKDGFFKKHRTAIGLFCLLINLAILRIPKEWMGMEEVYTILPTAMILMFIGIICIVPKIVDLYVLICTPVFTRLAGIEGMMAARNLLRNRGRTAVTISVIIIGMMISIGFNGVFYSFRSSTGEFVDKTFNYDVNISGALMSVRNINTKLQEVNNLPEIDVSTVTRRDNFTDDLLKMGVSVYGIIPAEYRRAGSFDVLEGNEDDMFEKLAQEENVGVIGNLIAEKYGIGIGDTYTFKLAGRPVRIFVIGVINDYSRNGRVVFINKELVDRVYGRKAISEIIIKAENPDEIDILTSKLKKIFPGDDINITTVTQIKSQWKKNMLQGTEIFDAINFVIMAVALFGLMNTLIMGIYERKREMGMLRSIGAGQGQIKKMVFSESNVIAILSIAMGALGGILFTHMAVIGMEAMSGFNINVYYPVTYVIMAVVLILLCSIIAAIYPSKMAAKGNIVEAIKGE